MAGQYFTSLEALTKCAEDAVKGAKAAKDKAFAKKTLERVTRYGVRTLMSSAQASLLQRIAAQHRVDGEIASRLGK